MSVASPAHQSLLAAALEYVPRTIPLAPRSKRPSVSDWPNWRATVEKVRDHWHANPNANVGIRTGNGLVVLDVDPRAGGHDQLADLEHEHGELPPTIEVLTGGGGRHLYFAGPRELPSFDLAAGVEIKAAGRQVVAPPSVHPETGALYSWVSGCAPGDVGRAALPVWLSGGRDEKPVGRQAAPVSEWLAIVRDGLAEGDRNRGLARLVGHLLGKNVDALLVAELVHLVNARGRPPLPDREVDRILQSIAGREMRRRKGATRS